MKRTLFAIAILFAAAAALSAQTQIDGLSPKDAKTMGMGGSFVTFSSGYNTFFGNPAGFASSKGSLTILDLATWLYVRPTQENFEKIQLLADEATSDNDKGKIISDLQAENNGLGGGAALGIGWAGKGFGLGLTMVSENYTEALKIKSMNQLSGILGLAFPIALGPVTFKLGIDGRAFIRTDSDGMWKMMDLMGSSGGDPSTLPVVSGYGFAADAGATIEFGPLMVGAAVRDLGFEFTLGKGTMQDIADGNVLLPGGAAYALAPKIYAGAGLKFELGKVLATSLYAETGAVPALFENFDNLWMNLHAGAEAKLFNFIALRGGLNKGYLSVGAGLDLLIFEIDAAVFTEEVGLYPGHRARSGIALQTAIRF